VPKQVNLGDDQPKTNPWQDDRLDYLPFAERLAHVIVNMRVPNGYVVGLHGKWGSGKTTVLNFILAFLKKHNDEAEKDADKVEHIDFRPWIVSGHQDLMAAFFKLLSEELKPKEGRIKKAFDFGMRSAAEGTDKLVDAAATLAIAIDPSGGVLSGLIGGAAKKGLNSTLGKFLEAPSLQKAYEDLKRLLSESGRRFLVTIDDIDRLEDEEIKSIMQMVKTIGRLPNVMYLLAYDREIVWQALDERVDRVGPKFAEKIIQQEVELPMPAKNSLLRILDDEIKPITEASEDSTRWQYIIRDGVLRWINLPRDVLRLSNALKFAWPALAGNFDAQDLVAIEGIRLFDPEAFEWVRSNRDFIFAEGRFFMGAEEERKANMDVLKASIPPATLNSVLELLTVLFPAQGKWFRGKDFIGGESHIHAQNRRGMASEAGYDSYFALRPSVDAVPKAALDDIFSNLDDEERLRTALAAYLGRDNSRGKAMVGLLLNDLRFRVAGSPKPRITQAFLDALFAIGEEVYRLPWRGGFFTSEPSGSFRYLVKDVLEGWGEKAAGEHLVKAFERSNSPFLIADIYVDRGRELGVFPDGGDNSRAVVSKEDFDKLGSILLPKLLAAVADGTINDAPFYWDITRAWRHLGNADDARAWIRQGIEQSAHFGAKVARGMVSMSSSTSGTQYSYRRDLDEDLYQADFLYEHAKRYLAEATEVSDDERKLLIAVVEGVDRVRANKSPDPDDDEDA
jgi:hypothetical protein